MEEVAHVLEAGLYVPIGTEESTSKVHKLFFSEPDWFVVIQDEINGEVVTIIPFAHYRHWQVSDEALQEARNLILRKKVAEVSAIPKISQDSKGYILTAVIESPEGNTKRVKLGSVPYAAYSSISAVAEDSRVHHQLREWVNGKMRPGEKVVNFFVRKGNRGADLRIVVPARP
jgi:hypothetical protein